MEENHMGWKLVRGVRQDIVQLFKMFARTKSVRYEDFCRVWKQMKFFTIFCSRYIYMERMEFVEELFHIVKGYLSSVYDFHNRVSALYTLYGLYYKQPLMEPVKIRFTKSEWKEVLSLIDICKSEKHLDVVFIYLKMLLNNAFVFVATERTAGLEPGYKKYSQKRYALFPCHIDVELLHRSILSEKLVSSLVQLEDLYCKKKLGLLGNKNLDLVVNKFSLSLQEELKSYASGNKNTINANSDETNDNKNIKAEAECIALSNEQKSITSEEDSSERRTSTVTTVKRKKLSGKYLLAKKKAELYITQLKGNQEKGEIGSNVLELPDLN